MYLFTVEQDQCHQVEYPPSPKSLEVTSNRDVPKKVYSKKPLTESSALFRPKHKLENHSKFNKTKKSSEYFGNKTLKRKVSDSSSSSSGPVKRGPGRPKKVFKIEDVCSYNDKEEEYENKEKRLKLDCSSKIKHKISSSSSSDLSPPVLEPCSPFSDRKISTHTPPTLSPSVTKVSDQKSSDEEKVYEKKMIKKRSTSSVMVYNFDLYFVVLFK